MTARKKTPRKKAGKKAKTAPGKQASSRAKTSGRRPARKQTASRSRATSLGERLTALVEHTASEVLRRVVDKGGRELAEWLPEAPEMRREAGAYLQELRELAGLTLEELSEVVELRDRSLLAAVEEGTSTLSFELILRLAAVLARHDPVPFISRMVRTYNPVLWQLLEDWGIGRLPLQLAREREFVNILRGHDEARSLSDEEFERVVGFISAAFEMALRFSEGSSSAK